MRKITFSVIIIAFLFLNFYTIDSEFEYFQFFESEINVKFDDWKELKKYFEKIGYFSIKNPPNIIVKSLPKNLSEAPVAEKKELFVKIMIPLIRKVNQEILMERKEILKAKENGDLKVLEFYMKKYDANDYDELLLKVNAIPEDIALAQAAVESAWGTSRFAIQANNIFGEWTFTPGTGIVPNDRPDGEIYEVEYFKSLLDSMRSYALNLNKLPYYEDFRLIRAGIKKGHPADGLINYSQMREKYVEIIKAVIKNLPRL